MTTSTSVGRRLRSRVVLLSLTTALCTGLAAPAFADSPHPNLDANGVDLTDGSYNLRLPIYSIGSGQAELALVAYTGSLDNWTNIVMNQSVSGGVTRLTFSLGTSFDTFTSADGYAASTRGTGATVTVTGDTAIYHTLEGVTIAFANLNPPAFPGGSSNFCTSLTTSNCAFVPTSIEGRSGMAVAFDWAVEPNCADQQEPDTGVACNEYWRLHSVSNDAGYAITWTYTNPTGSPVPAWFQKTTATFSNSVVSGTSPVVTYAYPSSGVTTITTPGGKAWRITGSGNLVTAVSRPSASSDTTTVSYSTTTGWVSSVANDGITTGYSRTLSGTTATTVVTDALSHATTIVSDMTKFRPISITDALSRTTTMSYDSMGRPTEIAYPEGNKVQYAYDGRGNLTTTTRIAKSGSGLSNIVTSASFPSSCTDASCNEPTTITDALGNVTDYAYDGTTGLVTSVTAPAATSGATRPQTRYSYAATRPPTAGRRTANGSARSRPIRTGRVAQAARTEGHL